MALMQEGTVNKTHEQSKPPVISVMSGREFARKLKIVADHRGLTMAEALDKYADPGVTREYRNVLKELNELGGES